VGPHEGLDVAEDLLHVRSVVINPLVEQIGHAELADHWMVAGEPELLGTQSNHRAEALLACRLKLVQEFESIALAVPPLLRHLVLVPVHELAPWLGDDSLNATGEAAVLRLEQVAKHFVDAPFLWSRVPAQSVVAQWL